MRASFFLIILYYTLLHLPPQLLLFSGSIPLNVTTDPSEVRALNSIFAQWDIQYKGLWNISGEPCSGSALNKTFCWTPPDINPCIKCNCSLAGDTFCHITFLRVQRLDRRGSFVKDLVALPYLTSLKIDKNYFSGPLPTFIGKLALLEELTISHNAFSGTIPMELGSLKKLKVLAISSNNFSGRLPHELGSLFSLEQLYMDSCGAGGPFPLSFANLRNLKIMWASDNPFTGKIPGFIGNWTKLVYLRINGNFFEGPIPISFSKLTSLEKLQISDLNNVSSSLDFIKSHTNIKSLVIRNALITGSIPKYIGNFKHLEILDLSFNNITGEIPVSLFTLDSLLYLFLGNNSLSGSLPAYKKEQLRTIDLSYNKLSGSIPLWVTQNLQLSLVANNFVFGLTNDSIFPGLDCLQRNFPCNTNTLRYTNFAINCGGPDTKSADGTMFEGEMSAFSPASYHVTNSRKWAVSNVGLFSDMSLFKDMSYAPYLQNSEAQVVGTKTPDLFNTSRISPGSLRYYGLNLENGPYTVNLLFAETAFVDRSTQTWTSLGRRVFDIYIQGSLREKDFDISKKAGGVNRAISLKFDVTVSQNYLEINLFWGGKGTCCIPDEGYYGPMISALSVFSDLDSAPLSGTSAWKRKIGLIVGIVVGFGIVILTSIISFYYVKMKRSDFQDNIEILEIGPKPYTFTYAELRIATENFNPANKLGEGGFGTVYKGILPDGKSVAIKQLSVASHHGNSQFLAELATISLVQHRNLVTLYGCCIDGDKRLIVYEYLRNDSLAKALFGETDVHLNWPTRLRICLGTARGLAYLHEESRPRIIHRDVKASNILLDEELCPKISDFGLAKLFDDNKTHISTRVAGTVGYLAPEYAMRGHLTEKADVFGFGVVALEILSGRPNFDRCLDDDKRYLLEWAWHLYERERSTELMDPKLMGGVNEEEALRVMRVAILCIQASPMMRPPMSRVVAMLVGDVEVGTIASKPGYLTDWDFQDTTNSYYLNDATASSTFDFA